MIILPGITMIIHDYPMDNYHRIPASSLRLIPSAPSMMRINGPACSLLPYQVSSLQ